MTKRNKMNRFPTASELACWNVALWVYHGADRRAVALEAAEGCRRMHSDAQHAPGPYLLDLADAYEREAVH